ncbi:biotin--[acetyl-CoA-carboxylase] ligase [Nocardiopsis kunsanensis]|uniref:biotin--[biotin carboxyl-carrier protein] ligase n=1 Tax=Nocardiopsis kunsanensis TaxID=141693 RepID=A0A918X924_9ACTN|nr:biotin--[acetyl-CoA-carboxylase] ligase [Nocardiopsis kunsanensis]GHD18999.1 biotin--[acetyl-CoA-carboxylase] ligase [Nocardiopsis kunsanensis]
MDLDRTRRTPLSQDELAAALVRPGGPWRRVEVLPAVGSTNTELLARAEEGEEEGTVLVAEHQTAGRGRLGRGFLTPRGAALTFSLLLRPPVAPDVLGWLPALMGAAAVGAVRRTTGVRAALKWPNDLIVPAGLRAESAETDGKLAGILADADLVAEAPAVVIGMGLNVSQSRGELPVPTAVSLRSEGATDLDRSSLLGSFLGEFEELYTVWTAAGGDAEASGLAPLYRDLCSTVGRRITVHLPGGELLDADATGIDEQARLVVTTAAGEKALSVGDVVHVRPRA